MSADPRLTASRYAAQYGVPYLYRRGRTLVLVTKICPLSGKPQLECKQAQSSAYARQFQRRAVAESGWQGNV